MYERYIVASPVQASGFGYWGAGQTLGEAEARWRQAGGKRGHRPKAWRFTSTRQFAPANRDATQSEADAYVDGNGNVCWVRCVRSHITSYLPS